jgi:hypothetical protein
MTSELLLAVVDAIDTLEPKELEPVDREPCLCVAGHFPSVPFRAPPAIGLGATVPERTIRMGGYTGKHVDSDRHGGARCFSERRQMGFWGEG